MRASRALVVRVPIFIGNIESLASGQWAPESAHIVELASSSYLEWASKMRFLENQG